MASFHTEPSGYAKTALSDLQGAWTDLREAVVASFGFKDSDRLLFHIDESMSWESVRSLERMKESLLLVRNIAAQSAPEEINNLVEAVGENLKEVLAAVAEGEAL